MWGRGVVVLILLVCLIGIISSSPFISFVNPTPDDGEQTTGTSRLKFKEIYEEIESGKEDAVTEEVVEEAENEQDLINKEEININDQKWIYFVVGVILVLLFVGIHFILRRKNA